MPELKLGDLVRIKLKIKKFEKRSFEPRYSVQIYKITKKKGFRYTLKNNKNNNELEKTYLARQLLRISSSTVDENNYNEILNKNKKKNKFVRKQKKEDAFKGDHVEEVNDDGDVVLKDRIKPTRETRRQKEEEPQEEEWTRGDRGPEKRLQRT